MASSFQATFASLGSADPGGELETAFEQAETCEAISSSD
jgi:hypothetical protein